MKITAVVFDFGGVMTTSTMPLRVMDLAAETGIPWDAIKRGFDAHRLREGRRLVLCGVDIPYERGLDGHYIYFKTRKRRISAMKRVEEEERLSQEEYLALMVQADPAFRPIHKQRYCLSENGLYYEIDIFPEWQDKAMMEIELHSEGQQIVFPEGIEVIREVTDDPAYSNHELARIR